MQLSPIPPLLAPSRTVALVGELASEDPFLTGAYAASYVRGCQGGWPGEASGGYLKMSAWLKHLCVTDFRVASACNWQPAHCHPHHLPRSAFYQSETADGGRFAYNGNVTAFDAWDSYLPPYAAGFAPVSAGGGGSAGAMCSYSSYNGVPSCASPYLLNTVVRGYWARPDAVIMSDCGAVEDQYSAKHWAANYSDASARSVAAGTDICDGTAFIVEGGLAGAVSSGELATATLDEALARALSLRMALGMFDPLDSQPFTTYGAEHIGTPTARALAAVESVEQGMVLLTNNGNLLPIDLYAPTLTAVAVVGPHSVTTGQLLGDYYGDAYCPGPTTPSNKSQSCVVSLGAATTQLLATSRPDVAVTVAEGVSVVGTSTTGIATAITAVQASDLVILALGNDNAHVEHEGVDRPNITLPGIQSSFAQQVLAAAATTQTPVVLLLINAGQVAIDELVSAPYPPTAIIEAFYPSFGAPAVIGALFGASNAFGRLPYTIYPTAYAAAVDLGSLAIAAAPGRTYRYLNVTQFPPLWGFGWGLSYSRFNLTVAGPSGTTVPAGPNITLTFNATSTNVGGGSSTLPGDDIVLVMHRVGADVARTVNGAHPIPATSLVEFARLSGIAVGASAGATLSVTSAGLALVNEAGASVVYPGTHYLDFSPRPPGLTITVTVTVTGSAPVVLAAPPTFPSPTGS